MINPYLSFIDYCITVFNCPVRPFLVFHGRAIVKIVKMTVVLKVVGLIICNRTY